MQQDKRPPLVVAMEWVSKVTTIGLEMALPPTVGHWLDERWDTEPWLVLTGAILGMAVAALHLRELLQIENRRSNSSRTKRR